ncbi:MAG TPA: hypothetical protein VFA05_10575 [Gaiellaceae bacterium]|nr:hypothetical protein [Gaiellaceae bacterium]
MDRRLLAHWTDERRRRSRARASLPASWRNDPRPRMADVREIFVEGIVEMQRRDAPRR